MNPSLDAQHQHIAALFNLGPMQAADQLMNSSPEHIAHVWVVAAQMFESSAMLMELTQALLEHDHPYNAILRAARAEQLAGNETDRQSDNLKAQIKAYLTQRLDEQLRNATEAGNNENG